MKYLKKFESNEIERIIQTLKDITIDLEDDGYVVDINFFNKEALNRAQLVINQTFSKNIQLYEYNIIRIRVYSRRKWIHWSDVKNIFDQCISYMRSEGWSPDRNSSEKTDGLQQIIEFKKD